MHRKAKIIVIQSIWSLMAPIMTAGGSHTPKGGIFLNMLMGHGVTPSGGAVVGVTPIAASEGGL